VAGLGIQSGEFGLSIISRTCRDRPVNTCGASKPFKWLLSFFNLLLLALLLKGEMYVNDHACFSSLSLIHSELPMTPTQQYLLWTFISSLCSSLSLSLHGKKPGRFHQEQGLMAALLLLIALPFAVASVVHDYVDFGTRSGEPRPVTPPHHTNHAPNHGITSKSVAKRGSPPTPLPPPPVIPPKST